MNQQEFMADFSPKGTTVTVDANELQALLRKLKESKSLIEGLKIKVKGLDGKIDRLDNANKVLELNKPMNVKLDIKV